MCICLFYYAILRLNKRNIATSNGVMNLNIWMDIYIIFFCFEDLRVWLRKIIFLSVYKPLVGLWIQRSRAHSVMKDGF